jgi:hypothetical protein
MLIELRLDAGLGAAVDAKRLVVGRGGYALGAVRNIFHKDARARVFLPVKRVHLVTLQNSNNKKAIHSTPAMLSSTHSAKYRSC